MIVIIIIYVLSAIAQYRFIQLAYYHKDGRWNSIKPNRADIFATVCPLFNSVIAFVGWCVIGPLKNKEGVNFFKPRANLPRVDNSKVIVSKPRLIRQDRSKPDNE